MWVKLCSFILQKKEKKRKGKRRKEKKERIKNYKYKPHTKNSQFDPQTIFLLNFRQHQQYGQGDKKECHNKKWVRLYLQKINWWGGGERKREKKRKGKVLKKEEKEKGKKEKKNKKKKKKK